MENSYGRPHRNERSRKKYKGYQQKLIVQKLMGLGLLAICAFVVVMACNGVTAEDRDCTALLFLLPMALFLLFTKEVVIY